MKKMPKLKFMLISIFIFAYCQGCYTFLRNFVFNVQVFLLQLDLECIYSMAWTQGWIVSIELPIAMTEKLLKAMLNPNTHTQGWIYMIHQ